MPPGVRISGKAFGKDRRMPITNHYRSVGATRWTGPGEGTEAGRALDPPSPEPARLGTRSVPAGRHRRGPLPLEAAAALMGEYRWIENALYRLLGEWVTDMPLAAVKVHLDGQSMRHAWHAELWGDRLPVLRPGRSGRADRALDSDAVPCSPS